MVYFWAARDPSSCKPGFFRVLICATPKQTEALVTTSPHCRRRKPCRRYSSSSTSLIYWSMACTQKSESRRRYTRRCRRPQLPLWHADAVFLRWRPCCCPAPDGQSPRLRGTGRLPGMVNAPRGPARNLWLSMGRIFEYHSRPSISALHPSVGALLGVDDTGRTDWRHALGRMGQSLNYVHAAIYRQTRHPS